ncbi:hypothetical protein [Flavobacterium daejeonense]|uniref:hypothetical protein n=1 Tax=Flavobacterium daejeonense TaxID=350893 RepID=UPI000A84D9C9|nr:hypothetical protein [Flavobacterium daejeonense]
MIQKLKIQKGVDTFLIVFALIYNGFYLQAQNQLDEKFKEYANKWNDIEYQVPKNYRGILVKGFYVTNKDFIQSSFIHGLKNDRHNIVVGFALITAKPDTTPRGLRIREVSGDPGRINLKAIASEVDTILAKVKYLDSLHLNKVKADFGVIYNMKMSAKYMGIYARCKKIILYKSERGRTEILFFYNKEDEVLVDEEINKTWGMLKFKS